LLVGREFAALRLREGFLEGGLFRGGQRTDRRFIARERQDDAREMVLHRRREIARRRQGLIETLRHDVRSTASHAAPKRFRPCRGRAGARLATRRL
jgi:hypothetical protein